MEWLSNKNLTFIFTLSILLFKKYFINPFIKEPNLEINEIIIYQTKKERDVEWPIKNIVRKVKVKKGKTVVIRK